ncbi:PrpF domain-containing protein, partial [Klebsiella pneumoniae]
CGNMLCAVGPFAIEQGLVEAQAGKTLVRIRNLNTNTFVDALVETPGGVVRYEGRTAIDGVPGTAAPVLLTFLDAVGSKTGRLFPTGSALDVIDGVAITCIDMAMPMMIVEARQLGVSGSETPAWLDADTRLLQ